MTIKRITPLLIWLFLVAVTSYNLMVEHPKPDARGNPHVTPYKNTDASKPAIAVTQKEYNGEGKKDKIWIEQLFDKPTDFLLMIFSGLLTLYTYRLYKATAGLFTETAGLRSAAIDQRSDMRESIAVANASAEAAKRSADALHAIEKGYLFLDDPLDGRIGDALIYPGPLSNLSIETRLKNHGRTPVIIRGIDQIYAFVPKLDDLYRVNIPGQSIPNGIVVASNELSSAFACKMAFSLQELTRARQNAGYIAYLVSVDYVDIFGSVRNTRACRVYDGGSSFYIWGSEKLNNNT